MWMLLIILVVFVPESKGTNTLSRAWNSFKQGSIQEYSLVRKY